MAGNKVIEMKTPNIGITRAGTRTILTPKEPLLHQNCEPLEGMYQGCLTQNKTEIILDCKSVSLMDSKGLELLLKMHNELKSRGGTLKIINLNAVCRDIMTATRLSNTFHVYKDIHEAVRSRA